MKRILSYISAIAMISLLFAGAFWYLFQPFGRSDQISISPLPDFLTLSRNSQVRLLDLWAPVIGKSYGDGSDVPAITAKSVLMYDLSTNKSIYEKYSTTRLPMASLTKIMTAITSLENKRSDDKYIVRPEDLVGENSMGLTTGEVLSHDDLLHGLLLPSGNDAAEALANNFPSGRAGFIKAMNDKAESLGLTDTNFTNPSGLQGDGEQYTTAYNLLVITRYALENFPEFRKAVATAEHFIPASDTHSSYQLYNETNLLTTYEGVKGVKTGYTPEAGLCLVTYLEYGDHKIIGIILGSENRRIEMKELLDYSLKNYGIEPPEFKG